MDLRRTHLLGERVRLGEEKPVEEGERERRVCFAEDVVGRRDVQQHDLDDRVRVVRGHAVSDALHSKMFLSARPWIVSKIGGTYCTAIMSDNGELVVPKMLPVHLRQPKLIYLAHLGIPT